jgi:hypothetical protein
MGTRQHTQTAAACRKPRGTRQKLPSEHATHPAPAAATTTPAQCPNVRPKSENRIPAGHPIFSPERASRQGYRRQT